MRKAETIFFAVAVAQAVGFFAGSARAENCPGHPDAIGTSRVLVIHPGEFSRLGSLQYPETLPLGDKEVVLTFDDGPLPPASTEVLDTLASQCVKATFFLVGEMAHAFPSVVRRIYADGHTIGTHSQDHPLRFDRLSTEKLRWEIDQGIANVATALGDPDEIAPFFRIPGLGRSNEVESELTARSLVTFSLDVVADDWFHRIKPAAITSRAMSRLERHNGGILLLHDIHKATAAALPDLLKELKDKGFHIVHVVFDGSPQSQIASAPKEEPKAELKPELKPAPKAAHTKWLAAISTSGQLIMDDSGDTPSWPQVDGGLITDLVALPAPDAEAFEPDYPVESIGKSASGGSDEARWPNKTSSVPAAAPQSPAPSLPTISAPPETPQVEGNALGLRRGLDLGASTDHDQSRRERVRARHHAASPRQVPGKHADFSAGMRALTALLTPPR